MEERKERCIRCEKMRVGDLKHGFGNPRKITKKKAEELERSLEMFGDFGIFLIDESDNVIAGNQRSIILTKKDPDIMVDCKRLIGYTDAELRPSTSRTTPTPVNGTSTCSPTGLPTSQWTLASICSKRILTSGRSRTSSRFAMRNTTML